VPSAATRTLVGLALASMACRPVMQPTLPSEPMRRAIHIDVEEQSKCLRVGSSEGVERRPDSAAAPMPPGVPVEIQHVARAAGVEAELGVLLGTMPDTTRDRVEIKLHLITRLSTLEIQLASLLFEVQCLGAQMDATLRELDNRQRKREIGLTVSSILVGAVTSAVGGVWEIQTDTGEGPAVLVISGGVASATLGLVAFTAGRHAVVYPHELNLLTPIATGEDPDGIYPRFVFWMLTTPPSPGAPSLRDHILLDWRRILDEGVAPRDRALAESLLYGPGGVYDVDLLDVREQMFDVLDSHIAGIDLQLELLYGFSARLVEAEGSTESSAINSSESAPADERTTLVANPRSSVSNVSGLPVQ
jgi:hypothetical protein